MSAVHDPKQRAYRVQFVCAYILAGRRTTRTFDSCLEMGDGSEVAAAVYKRALKNPKLMERLPRYLVPEMCKADYERIYGSVLDGTSGQDRANYTDTQDRENYT